MIYALIGCLIIIGFLGFKLYQKQKLDRTALNNYKEEISQATKEWKDILLQKNVVERDLQDAIHVRQYNEHLSDEYLSKVKDAEKRYNDLVENKMKALDDIIEEQRQKRQADLDSDFEIKKRNIELTLESTIKECDDQAEQAKSVMAEIIQQCTDRSNEYYWKVADAQERFAAIERVLASYEKDKQAKLFYTIQLPDEYQEDIEFLLTTVAAKVQHPDIISKLVWAEYVKPNLDETFKRIDIHPEPGIYKLTSLENGKCYIGKSTNVKTRIADHFKSAIGIKSIADQAVHHAILKEGFWNWQIEIITYCDKDKLSELEKYYIEFFKAQEFGYNKNAGG